jgi:hypothetical protein
MPQVKARMCEESTPSQQNLELQTPSTEAIARLPKGSIAGNATSRCPAKISALREY